MRSRLVILAVVGLLLGFLASCGEEPDRLTAKTLFPRVSKAQEKAGTSHIAMALTAPGGQAFASHGQMRIGAKPADTAMAMTVSGDGSGLGDVEIRLVDQAFYVALGALTDGKFAKIDLTDKSNPIAQQYGDLIQNVDPAQQVGQYEKAITKFDSSGDTVEIDGVKTQPYKITIDPSKAAQFKRVQGVTLPKTISVTLYIGPDDLPRRMVSRVPSGDGTTAKMQLDYSKWGEPVTIKAPSKANIADDDLLSRLAGSAGQ